MNEIFTSKLLNTVQETLGYDYVGLLVVDETTGKRVPVSGAGWPNGLPDKPLGPGQGLSERALLDGKLHYSPDVTNEPGYIHGVGGSEVDVPIWINDVVSAVLVIENNNKNSFKHEDFDILTAAANLTGLALTRARLFDGRLRQTKQQATLLQLSTELAIQLEEKSIGQKVVDCIHQKLGYDYLGFYLVDEDSGDRILQSSAGWPDNKEIARIPPGKGITELPILDGRLHYTPDVKIEPRYLAAVGGGSEVDLPIWIGESVGGVLAAEKKKPHAFDQSDFDILTAVANLTGLALTRSRLFSAERKQFDELAILHAVALAVTESTNEDVLIECITLIIGENLYPDNFGILLVDDNIGALRIHPSYNFQKEFLAKKKTLPFGQGVVGHVVETGLPERIADVTKSPFYWNVDSQTCSELAVPLKLGQRVIGVINVESSSLDAFSDADERFLITLAGQLATAIDRMRAAEAERQWAAKLARSNALIGALGQVAARIETASNLDSVLETLGQELKKLELTCLVALCVSGVEELSIRYTSFEPRVTRIFERISGFKMGEFHIPIEKLSSHIDLTQQSRPIILTDPVAAVAELLGGYPKEVVARVLEKVDFSQKNSVGHFPLLHEESLLGLLWLWGENLRKEDLPAMSIFANQVAVAIENARLFSEVQRLASLDDLTGLHNRRHFYSIAQIEFSRGRRYKRALAAMMLDIDHFKKFNDTYGHAIGDQVLQVVAKLCKQSLRETDILGRYGGEEFVILLPETNLEVAKTVAERLRKSIDEALISTQKGDLRVTVSIGVAENSEVNAYVRNFDRSR